MPNLSKPSYEDLVAEAMISEKRAQPLYELLRKRRLKQEAERALLKRIRPKHPGLTDKEILERKW